MSDLADLINRCMLSGQFISMNIMVSPDKSSFISMRRSYNDGYICDQVGDPMSTPADRVRDACEMILKEGRWAYLNETVEVDEATIAKINQRIERKVETPIGDPDSLDMGDIPATENESYEDLF